MSWSLAVQAVLAEPTPSSPDPAGPVSSEDTCYALCPGGLDGTADRGPTLGVPAPELDAVLFDPRSGEQRRESLASLLRGRPVILAFGSYT